MAAVEEQAGRAGSMAGAVAVRDDDRASGPVVLDALRGDLPWRQFPIAKGRNDSDYPDRCRAAFQPPVALKPLEFCLNA